MLVGFVLLAASAAFFVHNSNEERVIGRENDRVLEQMTDVIKDNAADGTINYDPYSPEMVKRMINGYEYVGVLTIEDLQLQLPVMSELDDYRLKLAPCLYTGSVNTDDVVIGAHNYKRHFGYLSRLRPGAQIVFTTMEGTVNFYTVTSIEVLMPNEYERLINGEYPLTLFTCTYGGEKRVVVRCDRQLAEEGTPEENITEN